MIVKSIVSVREVKIRISTFMLAGVKEDARLHQFGVGLLFEPRTSVFSFYA